MIMAGGRGTRFWPRSRRASAKQVLNVIGSRTLIQQTFDRLRPYLPPERMWVITNDYLRGQIARQLPEVPRRQIVAEPARAQHRRRAMGWRRTSWAPSIRTR